MIINRGPCGCEILPKELAVSDMVARVDVVVKNVMEVATKVVKVKVYKISVCSVAKSMRVRAG